MGVYRFMHKLKKALPNIIFENCCSGGGRYDLGMFYFSPLIWTSDNTHPIDRSYIQHGTSFGYPSMCISSHVSETKADYKAKCDVAFMGSYGFEMNPTKLNEEEIEKEFEGKNYGEFKRCIADEVCSVIKKIHLRISG